MEATKTKGKWGAVWQAMKALVARDELDGGIAKQTPAWGPGNKVKPTGPLNPDSAAKAKGKTTPAGRQSIPPYQRGILNIIAHLGKEYRAIVPTFQREMIPIIRKLVMFNADFGQALQNIVALGNTGHLIYFDKSVPEEQQAKMRDHILNKHKEWASGQAGADGVVNRMFSQIMIGGALSNEWVPNQKLNGIEALIMVNPEDIVFVLDDRMTQYIPFQRTWGLMGTEGFTNMVQLNTNTYRYYALNGDGEVPYGFPPYMTALDALETQESMHTNIAYVVKKMGLMGFLECYIEEPEQMEDEDDVTYIARLTGLLETAKGQVDQGMANGTIVGFKDKHEFKYNSIAKDFDKSVELYKQNELQMFSGLKSDATLAGRDYNSSESQITVLFMKMLAELKNIQNIVKCNLEFGYALELRLAGFQFDNLRVTFNKSTIQDDLKAQQAQEYKIKNLTAQYLLGLISTQQLAHELGYEDTDQPTPRVTDDVLAGMKAVVDQNSDTGKSAGSKGSKNASAKKARSKAKPQGSKK